jgi:hypothetical protein
MTRSSRGLAHWRLDRLERIAAGGDDSESGSDSESDSDSESEGESD